VLKAILMLTSRDIAILPGEDDVYEYLKMDALNL